MKTIMAHIGFACAGAALLLGCGLWPDSGSEAPLRAFSVEGWVVDMVFTSGGDSLFVASAGNWYPHKPARGAVTPPPPPSPMTDVTSLRFADGEPMQTLDLSAAAGGLVFTRDREYLLLGYYEPHPNPRQWTFPPDQLSMLRVATGQRVRGFEAIEGAAALDVTPDGRYVVSVAGYRTQEMAVTDLVSGDQVSSFAVPSPHARVSPSGEYVLAGPDLLRMPDGELVASLPRVHYAEPWFEERSAAFSPSGEHVLCAAQTDALGSDSMAVGVWAIPSGALVTALKGHAAEVRDVAVTPDGRHTISGDADGTLIVWRMGTWERIRTIRGHDQPITCVVVTPDGQHILSGTADGEIRMWLVDEPENAARLTAPY
jgi:hypothetical protein